MKATKNMKFKGKNVNADNIPRRMIEIQFKTVHHPTAVHKVSRVKRLLTEFTGSPSNMVAENRFAWTIKTAEDEAVAKVVAMKYAKYVSRGEVYVSQKQNRKILEVLENP